MWFVAKIDEFVFELYALFKKCNPRTLREWSDARIPEDDIIVVCTLLDGADEKLFTDGRSTASERKKKRRCDVFAMALSMMATEGR